MRTLYIILVFLHGIIHLLGFFKGFWWKEVNELTLPISELQGIVWVGTAVLFFIYGSLYIGDARYAWVLGLVAVGVSQIMVIIFWGDAKWGTIPNMIILLVSISYWGEQKFRSLVHQETNDILGISKHPEDNILEEADLASLPEPIKNWLRHSGAVGKTFIHTGKVVQHAKMRMKPGQKNWMEATAVQFTTIDKPAFIWTVDVNFNSLLQFKGRDKFENGKGEMLIKLNSLINLVNARGEKLDEGSLQRYLGEMVWFPSLALSPYITWEQIDATTAKARMAYNGASGEGTFYFNDLGDVLKFSASRYKDNIPGAKKFPWTMHIESYKTFGGIKVPALMRSTWSLEEGDWTWLKLEVVDLEYNPGISH